MSRPKKQKQVYMSKGKVRRMEQDAMHKCMILSAAYLMDDLGYTDDEIIDYWDSLVRWLDAIDEKTLTINKVCEIIEQARGLKIK